MARLEPPAGAARRAAAATALLAVAAAAGCGERGGSRPPPRGELGTALAAGVTAAVTAADAVVAPWRCARLDGEPPPAPPGGWRRDDLGLRRAADPDGEVTVVFVGDARGADDATVAATAALRRALDAAPPDLVVSLGGLGRTRAELTATLGALATGAPWTTVAIPGDREDVGEHRAAVQALAAAGARLLDGAAARLLTLDGTPGLVLGTLPGAPSRGRLLADAGGCAHDDADAAAIVAALARAAAPPEAAPTGTAGGARGSRARVAPPVVLASQRAPRGATDLAPGGVRAGDVALARALDAGGVALAVHAAVDDRGTTGALPRGKAGAPPRWAAAAVGALDATVRYDLDGRRVLPAALRLVADRGGVRWAPLAPAP